MISRINLPVGGVSMLAIWFFLHLESPKISVKEGLKRVVSNLTTIPYSTSTNGVIVGLGWIILRHYWNCTFPHRIRIWRHNSSLEGSFRIVSAYLWCTFVCNIFGCRMEVCKEPIDANKTLQQSNQRCSLCCRVFPWSDFHRFFFLHTALPAGESARSRPSLFYANVWK